jgi:O-antigen ligase
MRVLRVEVVSVLLAALTALLLVAGAADVVVLLLVAGILVLAARSQRRFLPDQSESPVVLSLLCLPTTVGLAAFNSVIAAAAVVGMIALVLVQGRRRAGHLAHPWLVLALAAAVILPMSRPVAEGLSLFWRLGVCVVLILCVSRFPRPAVIMSLLDGVGVYLIINVVGYFAGLQSPAAGGRTFALESSTGGARIFFPLTGSLAVPPMMAAIFVAAGLICFEGRRSLRLPRVVAFAAAVFVLLGANTRVALVASVPVLLASLVAPRLLARLGPPAAVLPMAVPFVFPRLEDVVVRPLIEFVAGALPFLSRGDVSSDVTLESRSFIWRSAIRFWNTFVDFSHQLVGFGELGQRKSGASAAYARGDPLLLNFSAHNSTLQQLFDAGLIGVLGLVVASLGAVALLAKSALRGSRVSLIGLSALLAGIVGGGTEVTQVPGYASETFWVFAGLVVAAAAGKGPRPSPRRQPTNRAARAGM